MNIKLNFYLVVFVVIFWTSCSTSKNELTYFENVDSLLIAQNSIGENSYGVKIVPEDELKIIVHSDVPEATAMYNLPLANIVDSHEIKTSSTPTVQTYTVKKDGYVELPVIGKLYVVGKTVDEVENIIRKEVSKQVKNPYVSVKLLNFRVNVLGEVNNPGVKIVTKERYSILDAIGEADDLTPYGKRDEILLIREESGIKKIYKFNLNDVKILESPYFYLQQNDVIVVQPNEIKKDNSKYNQNNAFKMTVVSTIVSAVSVIASLAIALIVR